MKFTDLGPREPDVKPPLLYRDIEPGDWFQLKGSDKHPRLKTIQGHVAPGQRGRVYEDGTDFATWFVILLTDVDLQYRKVD